MCLLVYCGGLWLCQVSLRCLTSPLTLTLSLSLFPLTHSLTLSLSLSLSQSLCLTSWIESQLYSVWMMCVFSHAPYCVWVGGCAYMYYSVQGLSVIIFPLFKAAVCWHSVCVRVCTCVCAYNQCTLWIYMCVCVGGREGTGEREREGESERERESSLQDFVSKHAGEKERVAPTSELLYCLFFNVW